MTQLLFGLLLLAPAPSVDVRVDGEGFFRFEKDGRAVYAKQAVLTVINGRLAHLKGAPVLPTISVPAKASKLTIDLDGSVKTDLSPKEIGRLVLVKFPDDIRPVVSGDFLLAAEKVTLGNPGEGIFGVVRMPGAAKPAAKPAPKPEAPKTNKSESTSGSVQIDVRPKSDVFGDSVTLGDIAEINAGEKSDALKLIDLGPSPLVGVSRTIYKSVIESKIKQNGFKLTDFTINIPAEVKVIRAGQSVTHEAIVQEAIRYASQLLNSNNLVNETPGAEMAIPVGEVKLVPEKQSVVNGKITVLVGIYIDGKRFNGRNIILADKSPEISLKVGQPVKIRVKSGGAAVETIGKVKAINSTLNQITVEASTGAILIGTLSKDGAIEVKLT